MNPLKKFAIALVALLALTAASFGLSLLSLGGLETVAALTIAGAKVLIVALVFMELGHAGTASRLAVAITAAFVTLLCLGILADVLYR